MDILFGTYRCPDHEPERLGVDEPTAKSYLRHMVRPLVPYKWMPGVKPATEVVPMTPQGFEVVMKPAGKGEGCDSYPGAAATAATSV